MNDKKKTSIIGLALVVIAANGVSSYFHNLPVTIGAILVTLACLVALLRINRK